MSGGLGYEMTGGADPRSGKDALVDSLGNPVGRPTGASERRETAHEHALGRPGDECARIAPVMLVGEGKRRCGEGGIVSVGRVRHQRAAAEGRRRDRTASGTPAAVRCMRWSGIVYLSTLARAAQARAVSEIDPFAAVGTRSLIRSRKRALAISSSDIA